MFTDSDWAGCKEIRKSSSAGVMMLGRHALKTYTRKQKVIVKSSAKAELYAAAFGASEAKGVQSMMCDLGFAVKPVLTIDAKALEHILHRQGIGQLKHTDVAYLWVQDEIRSQILRVGRVRSEENVADLGTKLLSKTVIAKHCLKLGYVDMDEENVQSGWLWRYSGTSVHSGRQQVTMSRSQPAETRSNRSKGRIRSSRRASRSCSRCQRGCCSTLPWIMTHCSNRLRKVQTGRTHTSSSAESAPNVSVARKSRRIFTEHHEVLR